MNQIANIIGLLGVLLLLIAYFLLQSEKIKSTELSYSVYNLFGSLMILYSLLFAWNLPAVIIEAIWALLSLFGIVKLLKKKKE